MTVLVTGGAGYIGRETLRLMPKVSVSVDLRPTTGETSINVSELSILDTDRLVRIMDIFKVKRVIHLAALISVPDSVKYPISYYQNNVSGTLSLIHACKQADITDMVFASTAAAGQPCNPYGYSKAMCEQILRDSGLRVVALRYFNVGGGEMNVGSPLLINRIARVAAGRDPFLTVYGDGSQVRDYVHVMDVARANLMALDYLRNAQDDYTQMDICTGTGSSVGQVVAACSQDIDVRFEGERAGDPSTLIGNPSRAKALLGWQPRFGLKDIVNSVRWHHEP
jgi:UDP-glucose 4-epimerase